MTPAELKTRREALGLSGEQLISCLPRRVGGNTGRKWESDGPNAIPVPDDVAETVAALEAIQEQAVEKALAMAAHMRATHGDTKHPIALVRYRTDADVLRFVGPHPQFGHLPRQFHAAMLGRVDMALRRAGYGTALVYLDPGKYDAWRVGQGLAEGPAARAAWATAMVISGPEKH